MDFYVFVLSSVCYVFVRVCLYKCMCFVVTCWERADLLALVCGVNCEFCHFPIGILGQVWYLIVSIPDLCTLTYSINLLNQACKWQILMYEMCIICNIILSWWNANSVL